ncbi:hypothetical protein FIBSPDRAFT_1054937 [Athelia psychrophila]|uniref:Mid2 domain-containing protein n=1 Tax=Athelia psychrophila TaxID=1759441 RepID=A0A167UK87_9AGAM|nr:hypothetical protein FIBSPDRAFT_1054937 [Fibularhizoctonia sp. CBS 109695]
MLIYCIIMFSWALSCAPLAVQAQGNTTCKGTTLDWYTSVVGESPCQTYQSLRQICNAEYTVGSLLPVPMNDRCNDQVAGCCCNSIAFGLSMLCLNCQLGTGSDENGEDGHNALTGNYQTYLGACSPNANRSLPADIQQAVCNEKIKIDDDFYGQLFWDTGQWFYQFSRELMQQHFATYANNTFTHCASTTIIVTSSIPAQPSSTNTSNSIAKHSSISGGAVGDIAIAAVAGLAFAGFLIWFFLRRRRASADVHVIHHADPQNMGEVDRHIDPFYIQPSDALVSDAPTSGTSPTLASRHMASGKGSVVMGWNRGSSEARAPSTIVTPPPPGPPTVEPTPSEPERHLDAGRLGRSPSGRLPPAYGEQNA